MSLQAKRRNLSKRGSNQNLAARTAAIKRKKRPGNRREKLRRSLNEQLDNNVSFQLNSLFKKSVVLDKWNPKRRKFGISSKIFNGENRISLSRFSFIDNPLQTLKKMNEIARNETKAKTLFLNFDDQVCWDIGPYVFLSLFIGDLRKGLLRGGHISPKLRKVLNATGVANHIGMTPDGSENDNSDVWPIFLKSCKQSVKNKSLSSASGEHAQSFTNDVNGWLEQLGFKLTREGKDKFIESLCEILDNAIIHGAEEDEDGSAWVSGFMAKRQNQHGNDIYVCHLTVINFGPSIYTTMQKCDSSIRNEIENLVKDHSKVFQIRGDHWRKKDLWTLSALQDGVTRYSLDEVRGGKGLMEFLELIGELGHAYNTLEEGINDSLSPRVVISSGETYIQIPGVLPILDQKGFRSLALNNNNNLKEAPDSKLARTIKPGIPGTILSARFVLDKVYLTELSKNTR